MHENEHLYSCYGVDEMWQFVAISLYVLMQAIICVGYSDEMLELVLFALEDLRKSLKGQGSDVMIRFGKVENVIKELVDEVVICYNCLVC